MKRAAVTAFGLLVALAVALLTTFLVLSTSTSYSERGLAHMGRPGDPVPPRWTQPCWRFKGTRYVLPCSRVRGVIVYRERHDPDGDGDVHGLAVAGRRLVIIKSNPSFPRSRRIPGVGRRMDVAGVTQRGRFGLAVVDVRRIHSFPR